MVTDTGFSLLAPSCTLSASEVQGLDVDSPATLLIGSWLFPQELELDTFSLLPWGAEGH